jgi:hypothetical protein
MRTTLLLSLALVAIFATGCPYSSDNETDFDVDSEVDASPLPPLNDPGLEPGVWTQAERQVEPLPSGEATDAVWPEYNAQDRTAEVQCRNGGNLCGPGYPTGYYGDCCGPQTCQVAPTSAKVGLCVFYYVKNGLSWKGIYHISCEPGGAFPTGWNPGSDGVCSLTGDPKCTDVSKPQFGYNIGPNSVACDADDLPPV